MTPSWIRAFLWFSSKIVSISDSMIEAVVDLLLKFLKLIGVANFYKYAILSKFLELKRRPFVRLTK